ncbi:hypothetical protein [Nocardioides marmoraquaticus]
MPTLHDVVDTGRRVLHPAPEAPWWHRAPTFVVVGGAWTLLYLVLYAVLRDPLGAQLANAVSLVLTTIGSTDSHRGLTFDVQSRSRLLHLGHQALGLALLGAGLAITSGSLALLHVAAPGASTTLEVLVLLLANGIAGALRFGVFHLVMRDLPAHRAAHHGSHH